MVIVDLIADASLPQLSNITTHHAKKGTGSVVGLFRRTTMGRTRVLASVFGMGIALLLSVSPALADKIYDVAADWSYVNNPNGVWSYNQGSTPLPSVQYNGWGGWGLTVWTTGDTGTKPPAWFKAAGPQDIPVVVESAHWAEGDVIGHSTTLGQGATGNVTWTSPKAGTITIAGKAWDAYHQSDRNSGWLLYVGSDLVAQRNNSNGGVYDIERAADAALFANNLMSGKSLDNLSVQAGDVVKFEIEALTDLGMFVGLDLKIDYAPASAVPLPSVGSMTLVLLLLAGGGARLAAWRRVHTRQQ
jgi:hypothetical protein